VIVIVAAAMRSSLVQVVKGEVGVANGEPAPKDERPSARRNMWSMCFRAAVVEGEVVAPSTERDVAVEGKGRGMCVARNMW